MSYETTLEHAIRAADEGAISVGGSWRRLPLAPYLPAGRAVREILAEAEIVIAERDAFKAAWEARELMNLNDPEYAILSKALEPKA